MILLRVKTICKAVKSHEIAPFLANVSIIGCKSNHMTDASNDWPGNEQLGDIKNASSTWREHLRKCLRQSTHSRDYFYYIKARDCGSTGAFSYRLNVYNNLHISNTMIKCRGGLVVSVSAPHTTGHGFASRPAYTKDYHKNGTICLSAWYAMR